MPFKAEQGNERIGEIWFDPPPELNQLLVKYIFTSQPLSVQVHPSDHQTIIDGLGCQGKEECWLIVDAEPAAKIGIGFTGNIDADDMRSAALDGSIEGLLSWHQAKVGDFFYIPANTVHAIGGGISLIEVQQNSDITYRLYDYGRSRELHLEKGVAVAKGARHDRSLQMRLTESGNQTLVEGPFFRLDRLDGRIGSGVRKRYAGSLLVIPQEGSASVAGERLAPGQCALAGSIEQLELQSGAKVLVAQSL